MVILNCNNISNVFFLNNCTIGENFFFIIIKSPDPKLEYTFCKLKRLLLYVK